MPLQTDPQLACPAAIFGVPSLDWSRSRRLQGPLSRPTFVTTIESFRYKHHYRTFLSWVRAPRQSPQQIAGRWRVVFPPGPPFQAPGG